ncbi:GSCFA domain-containing protein [Sphingomonas sabuli]|uniref:GSCFA domain-containing protein n=1 Tax=Sphingomonas sabuli TaxID=2764186 RepID=A0A7G9L5A1_9SPHN|nr:GSCFA domain-containing protein [Sphingomonas sabuli]QNM83800.1 GSCFA domain-containing protein [Sphingomonas sabuli]
MDVRTQTQPPPHPYTGLDSRQFWRTAVERVPRSQIAQLASPKNKIGPNDVVGTAGSCFAQHIARNLKARGFPFLDVEPAPELLRADRHGAFGFGMFSARYGNIYTAAQLRQLVERAFDRFKPTEAAWRRDDRYFDPFRPNIEPNGFASEEEMLDQQAAHLQKVRRLINKIDVFVFTLGLTEGWRAKADGSVFPIAPGVQGIGHYDPDKYDFVNFDYNAVRRDLAWTFDFMRQKRPGLRFLLTVSPVPLAATYDQQHVITATTYSKAVLRAVAGDLSSTLDHVDYFPSYELITAPVFEGRAYEENWRDVRPEAVSRVMEHFFGSFVSGMPKRRPDAVQTQTQDDVVCEEAVLASYAE